MITGQPQPEQVLLVGVDFGSLDFAAALAECADLVLSAAGYLVDTMRCKRAHPNAALFVGSGKAKEIAAQVQALSIELVVFNHALSPSQERNLEKILQCRVLDRVGLILAIFARRAQTQEGKLQVELAQLTYLSSRLVRGYRHLQSQRGGIGLKGPGETQLETDRRLLGKRMIRLKSRLQDVRKQRNTQRKSRQKEGIKTVALVGYTNAGKSSLFNRLTKADVFIADQLFATLDPSARKLFINQDVSVILTDTVGFVRDLPHSLVAAFTATLEETAQADILLHIVDASSLHSDRQIDDVNKVLDEIGAGAILQIMVYNKIDLLSPELSLPFGLITDALGTIVGVRISVKTGMGLDALRELIATQVGILLRANTDRSRASC